MANPNKAKGTRWESALVAALGAFFDGRYGLKPRRTPPEGLSDAGDLHGLSPFIAQAKDWRSWESAMREGLDGAERQKIHAGEPYGVAFVKRARKPAGGGYAVLTVATWARLLVRLKRAEAALAEADPERYAAHAEETATDLEGEFPRGR